MHHLTREGLAVGLLTRFRSEENIVPQTETTPEATSAWPEGVFARYLTVAGATVDLTGGGDRASYRCTGCSYGRDGLSWVERVAREHAQGHAEKCRALPKP